MLMHLKSLLIAAIVWSAFFTFSQASAAPPALGSTTTGPSGLLGPHLALPTSPTIKPPFEVPTYATGPTFPGTWVSPAGPAWVGTFNGSGPLPIIPNSGTTTYKFAGLNSSGTLPTSTFFIFYDVDAATGPNDKFELKAFDASGLITTPWLSVPVATWESIPGSGAAFASAMPGWAWSSSTGTYTIDGSTATCPACLNHSPNFFFALQSEMPIAALEVVKFTKENAFGLAAPRLPVPEPSTWLLFGTGLFGLFRNGLRRQWSGN
jgi:hypothetical protein